MKKLDLNFVKGDTFSFSFEVSGLTDDLASAYFSCKESEDDSTNYSFQKSLSNGITKLETGIYQVRIAPEDTASLEAGTYYYDLELGIGSDIFTILKGKLVLEQDITISSGGN